MMPLPHLHASAAAFARVSTCIPRRTRPLAIHAALAALRTAFSRKLASADDAAKDLLAEEATRAGVYISVVLKCSRECVDLLNVLQWTMLSTLDYR